MPNTTGPIVRTATGPIVRGIVGPPPPGAANTALSDLVASYPLSEASGVRYDDQGSEDLEDTTTVGSNTGHIYALAADFASDSLKTTDGTHGMYAGARDFSVSAWVRADVLLSKNTIAACKGSNTANQIDWRFYTTSSGIPWFQVNNGSNYYSAISTTHGILSVDTWYWIYGEYNYASNLIGISVNNGTLDTVTGPTTPNQTGYPVYVGRSGTVTEYWDGRIQQFNFWSALKSADDRTALYNDGNGIPFSEFG